MLDYKKNPRPHATAKFLLACGTTFLLLVVAIIAARAAWSMYGKFASASAAAEDSQKELARLEAQKADVSASIEDLSSDRGIEATMRERFGVAKPGEGEIYIVRKEGGQEDASPAGDQNIFTRIFHAIFVW